MEQVLLNHKTVNKRKKIKRIRKNSGKRYLKGKSVSKTKIGKVVELMPSLMENKKQAPPAAEADLDRLMELLQESGLTGMSGNGYKVKAKLEALLDSQSGKVLIVNGAECEPGLIHDEWLMTAHREEIAEGIRLISGIIPFERCILACKLLKSEKGISRNEQGFEVVGVPANFPMGEERLLIKQVLGKTLDKDEYPTDAGILVMNVQTVYQIYRLLTKKYSSGRYITVADLDSGEAKAEYVERGENIIEKLKASFPGNTAGQYFAGSGIMSAHPVTQDERFSDQVSFAAVGMPADISETVKCKGCGKCNHKCPSGVNVKEIVKRREADMKADITDLDAEKCIQCGSCTFFCRAGKNLVGYVNG